MTVLGCLRLSQKEIVQIIADHMAAKYGVDSVKVEFWPPKDRYGNDPFALVEISGFAHAVRHET